MNILLTGGTGLLGRALCSALLADGHTLCVLSRRPEQVRQLCGASVRAIRSLDEWRPEEHFDALINLAGAPIIDRPWSAKRQHVLWASRVTLTEQLVAAMARAEHKPAVLLSGSAIGIYGDCGDSTRSDVIAKVPPAQDFGARLCTAWEAAASQAEGLGVRVCLLRTGLVVTSEGGLLARLRLPYKLGLGGRLGHGQQWMSWIHLDDWIGAVLLLLLLETAHGAFNLTAPQPVRNVRFNAILAAAVHRPAFCAAPGFVLRALLGARAYLLLGGQRVLPERLLALGYTFQFPNLAKALEASL